MKVAIPYLRVSAVKPANLHEHRKDRRLAINQSDKRKAVVVIRERDGNTLPAVFRTKGAALSFVRSRIAKGTQVHADESANWNDLHSHFEMKRINHQEAYSYDGACTNWAEEFFSRMRRAEIGHHHHIAGAYLLRYAQEASWREDCRKLSNASRFTDSLGWRRNRVSRSISAAIGKGISPPNLLLQTRSLSGGAGRMLIRDPAKRTELIAEAIAIVDAHRLVPLARASVLITCQP